jgi:hypothetical protein
MIADFRAPVARVNESVFIKFTSKARQRATIPYRLILAVGPTSNIIST